VRAKWLIAVVLAAAAWMCVAAYGAISGWWLTPVAAPGDARAFMNAAIAMSDEQSRGNIALVLIRNRAVFDMHFTPSRDSVNADTRFPLASMSKWFTAYGVMQLVQAGTIDLDAPASTYLKRWQLPAGNFDNSRVTVRRLLSHTAGFTDGLGFGDYSANEVIPSVDASLRNPRASSGKVATIAVGREPGSEWQYSGGGYLVLQAIVEDVTGMQFAAWMQKSSFGPLGMNRASYAYIDSLDGASASYDTTGRRTASYQYAAAAATGLSASVRDLTTFAQAQLRVGRGGTSLLSAENVARMREPHGRKFGADIWGLGVMLYAPTAKDDYVFGHDGSNDPAINTSMRVNPDNGDALIVLVTGNPALATLIGAEWTLWQTGVPDFLMLDRAVRSAIVPLAVGLASIAAIFWLVVMRERRVTRSVAALPLK
jgi:CubicO group peptidase (beta-lactamase class C family)